MLWNGKNFYLHNAQTLPIPFILDPGERECQGGSKKDVVQDLMYCIKILYRLTENGTWVTAAYRLGNASSRMITEVKQRWARLVLWQETHPWSECELLSNRGHIWWWPSNQSYGPSVEDDKLVIVNTRGSLLTP